MRKIGFGAVLAHQMDGISRGTSTFVTLGDEPAHQTILKDMASHHMSFSKGTSTQSYPGSCMSPDREQVLVEQAKTEPDAFAELYHCYVDRIYAFVYRAFGDGDEG